MNQYDAGLAGAQQVGRQFKRAKTFRPINENGIAGLKLLWQNFARVAEQKIHICVLFEPRLGDRCVRAVAVQFHTDDPCVWETASEHERAPTAHPAGFQDLPRGEWAHRRVKEKHSSRADAPRIRSSAPVTDSGAELGHQLSGSRRDRCDCQWRLAHRPMNLVSLA